MQSLWSSHFSPFAFACHSEIIHLLEEALFIKINVHLNVHVKWIFLLVKQLGSNYKHGRLREVYSNGSTVLDTRWQAAGWHNMHLVQGNWIMGRTSRLPSWLSNGEGKLDSWLNDVTYIQSKKLKGQVIHVWDIMCTWCNSWAVNFGESCNTWFVLCGILID